MARSGFPEVIKTLGRNLEVSGPNRKSRVFSYNPTPTWASAGIPRTNVSFPVSETQPRKQGQGCRRFGLVVGPSLQSQPSPLPTPIRGSLRSRAHPPLCLCPGWLIFNRSYIRSPTLLILSKHLENIIPVTELAPGTDKAGLTLRSPIRSC